MSKNSAAKTFYGRLTASKIRRLIRRAVIFPADFRRTNIWRRIRRSEAAEDTSYAPVRDCMGRPIRPTYSYAYVPIETVIFDTNNHEAN